MGVVESFPVLPQQILAVVVSIGSSHRGVDILDRSMTELGL